MLDLSSHLDELLPSTTIFVRLYKKETHEDEGLLITEINLNQLHKVNPLKVFRPFFVSNLNFKTKNTTSLQRIDILDHDVISKFYETFENYYQAVKNKDVMKFMSFHKKRTSEYEDRLKEKPDTRFDKLKESISNSFSSEFLLLRKQELIGLNLHLYGKLLTIDFKKERIPLVSFTGEKGDYIRSYQAYWALDESNEFFIFR